MKTYLLILNGLTKLIGFVPQLLFTTSFSTLNGLSLSNTISWWQFNALMHSSEERK
jgi:hypothetical protein